MIRHHKFDPPLHEIFNEGSSPGLEVVRLVAPTVVPSAVDRFKLRIFRRLDHHTHCIAAFLRRAISFHNDTAVFTLIVSEQVEIPFDNVSAHLGGDDEAFRPQYTVAARSARYQHDTQCVVENIRLRKVKSVVRAVRPQLAQEPGQRLDIFLLRFAARLVVARCPE